MQIGITDAEQSLLTDLGDLQILYLQIPKNNMMEFNLSLIVFSFLMITCVFFHHTHLLFCETFPKLLLFFKSTPFPY